MFVKYFEYYFELRLFLAMGPIAGHRVATIQSCLYCKGVNLLIFQIGTGSGTDPHSDSLLISALSASWSTAYHRFLYEKNKRMKPYLTVYNRIKTYKNV